jgi:hypothetical protein
VKWNPQDVEVYLQSKEYVDTAVIPLLPVAFDSEMGQAAAMSEFITLVTGQLERQFKGRILLLPGFSYLKIVEEENTFTNLLDWETQLKSNGFKHIFYLTSDVFWKPFDDRLSGSLIWIPSIPLETMQESMKISVVESQIKQMINLFTREWHEKE